MNYANLFSDCWALGSYFLPSCGLPTWAAAFLPGLGGETITLGHRRFRVLRKLGEGGYAIVLLVSEVPTGLQPHVDPEPRALKKVLVQSGEHFEAVQQEMLIHSTVQHHPNILPLLDYCCSEGAAAPTMVPTPQTSTASAAAPAAGHHQPLPQPVSQPQPRPQPSAGLSANALPGSGVSGGGGGKASISVSVGVGLFGAGGGGGGADGGGGGCDRVACFLFPVFRDGTLATELDRLRERGEMLPTREVLSVFTQVARAAAHVHAHGYAHRDIKPLNVLIATNPEYRQPSANELNPQQRHQQQQWRQAAGPGRPAGAGLGAGAGVSAAAQRGDVEAGEALMAAEAGRESPSGPRYRCVLMDFGSARLRGVELSTRAQALALQEDAEAHCSAPYRAPELFDAPSPSSLDLAACDVWALGATLFHVMYGEPPFQRAMNAAGGSLALAVLNCAIGWPRPGCRAYPPDLHELVLRAMAQEPRDRPSAEQLAEMATALRDRNLPDPQPAAAGAAAGQQDK